MDYNPKDIIEMEEGQFRILLLGKIDAMLENRERVDKRLDSHSNQLKAIWSGGVLSGFFAAWVNSGHK